MSTIGQWYEAALQQLASESYLRKSSMSSDGAIAAQISLRDDLARGNTRENLTTGGLMKMPVASVEQLSSGSILPANEFAAAWEVVYQADNDGSGFSATLMRRRVSGNADPEYTLAFRSTEYRDEKSRGGDWKRDVENADAEIGMGGGFAFGQIHSMRQLWTNLKAGRDADGKTLTSLSDFASRMSSGEKVNLVGYSLGGQLATVLTELEPTKVNQTTIFNAVGRGALPVGTSLRTFLDYFENVLATPSIVGAYETTGNTNLSILRDLAIQQANKGIGLEASSRGIGGVNMPYVYDDARYQFAVAMTKLKYPTQFAGSPGTVGEIASGVQDKITNLFGHATHNDVEYVANSGVRVGANQTQYIFIEDQPNIEGAFGRLPLAPTLTKFLENKGDFGNTHSITLIVDTLALMSTIQLIDPTLAADTTLEQRRAVMGRMQSILASGANLTGKGLLFTTGTAEADSLEKTLDALRVLYIGNSIARTEFSEKGASDISNGFANAVNRTQFYTHLADLKSKIELLPGGTLTPFVSPTMFDNALSPGGLNNGEPPKNSFGNAVIDTQAIVAKASQTDAEGRAYRYALGALNDFVLTGNTAVYAGKTGIDLADGTHPDGMTAQYIKDRAALLERKLYYNVHDTPYDTSRIASSSGGSPTGETAFDLAPSKYDNEDIIWSDADSKLKIQRGSGTTANTIKVSFGSIHGGPLVGLDANPSTGYGDRLFGGARDDILRGNKGNDYLEGGAGLDVYEYRPGDGNDTVVDTDGRGVIRYFWRDGNNVEQSVIVADGAIKGTGDTWTSADGKFSFSKVAALDAQGAPLAGRFNLQISMANATGNTQGGVVTIKDFDFTTAIASRSLGIRLGDTAVATPVIPDPTRYFFGGIPVSPAQEDTWHNLEVYGGNADYNNTIYGSPDSDSIQAGGGNDTVAAALSTGPEATGDTIDAGTGNDVVTAGGGNDKVFGGTGDDNVTAGAGNDWLLLEAGNDFADAGSGNDLVEAGTGQDIVLTGAGDDRAYADAAVTLADLFATSATINGSGSSTTKGDFLDGGEGDGDDILIGGVDADALMGGFGEDVLVGLGGNDDIFGDDRAQSVSGGWVAVRTYNGSGFYSTAFTGAPLVVIYDGIGQEASGNFGHSDTIYAGKGDDFIAAGGGDDYVDAGEGVDVAFGEMGADVLIMGAGNDTAYGDSSNTRLAGNPPSTNSAYNDFIDGGEGSDSLFGGYGSDILLGGAGNDTLRGDSYRTTGDSYDADGARIGEGEETIIYWAGDDFLDGGDDSDYIYGYDGADMLIGGKQNDFLYGGYGRDTYVLNRGDGEDTIIDPDDKGANGAANPDKSIIVLGEGITRNDVVFKRGSLLIDLGQGDQIHLTLPANQTDPAATKVLERLEFADGTVMTWTDILAQGFDFEGTSGNDTLSGTVGRDWIRGLAGNDSLSGLSSDDTLDGGDGDDTLRGDNGNDLLRGGAGHDTYLGIEGQDIIDDLIGNNQLNISQYVDSLTLSRNGNDLVLTERGFTNSVTFKNGFATGGTAGWTLNANGTSISLSTYVGMGALAHSADTTALVAQFDTRWQTYNNSTATPPRVNGGSGVDTLTVTTSSVVDGAGGNDTLTMNKAGGTTYFRGIPGSVLIGGTGDDTLKGGGDDDILTGGTGNNLLDGGAGEDHYVLFAGTGTDTIIDRGGLEVQTSTDSGVLARYYAGYGGFDRVYLPTGVTAAGLTYSWSDEAIQIERNAAILHGVLGSVPLNLKVQTAMLTLTWGSGTQSVKIAMPHTDEQADFGIEEVRFSDGSFMTRAELLAAAGYHDLDPNAAGSTITADNIDAEAGNDTLSGNGILRGGEGDDSITGGSGRDAIAGDEGADTLTGGVGADLMGFGIREFLGAGNTYSGGLGNDIILGTLGADTYLYNSADSIGDYWRNPGNSPHAQELPSMPSTWTGNYADLVEFGTTSVPLDYAGLDTLRFGAGINASAVGFVRATGLSYSTTAPAADPDPAAVASSTGSDLVLSLSSTEQVRLVDWYKTTLPEWNGDEEAYVDVPLARTLARVEFADGTVWNQTYLAARSTSPMVGTSGNDNLTGTGGTDWLAGLAGNDSLTGGAENDALDGGAGADVMAAGAGDDTYLVDSSGDTITESADTGAGTDTVFASVSFTLAANVEQLELTGTANIDASGNGGNNVLRGNSGNNVLDGGAGADTMEGMAGDDVYVVDNAGDSVSEAASAGADTVRAGITWVLGANVENLVLTGNAAINGSGNALANSITGNSAANTLEGGAGADTLTGAGGNDTLIGDALDTAAVTGRRGQYILVNYSGDTWILDRTANRDGFDRLTGILTLRYDFDGATQGLGDARNPLDYIAAYPDLMAAYHANEAAGFNHLLAAGVAEQRTITFDAQAYLDTYADLKAAFGTDLRAATTHYILGGAAELRGATLNGDAGADTLWSGAGNDWLDGRGGADIMAGGIGDDTYVVDNAEDVVQESASAGYDSVRAGLTWTLGAHLETLLLTGNAAINGTGNALNNLITGNSAANSLIGAGGDDELNGGAGADTLEGGSGNDVYHLDHAGDIVVEAFEAGSWDVAYTSVSRVIASNIEALVAQAGSHLTGDGADNTLYGNFDVAANTLTGGAGNDGYHVGAGDVVEEDSVAGAGAWDVEYAYANRTIDANIEGIVAMNGAAVSGDGRANALYGTLDAAANTLAGGTGNDTYYAARGMGADTVVENDATAGNADVAQFLSGVAVDQLWFSQIGNDLETRILGTGDKLLFQNWYSNNSHHVEQFRTTDGNKTASTTDTYFASLVQAMTTVGGTGTATSIAAVGMSTEQRNSIDTYLTVWQ